MNNDTTTLYLARFFGYFALSLGIFMTVLTGLEFICLNNAKNIKDVTKDEIHIGIGLEGEVPYTIGCYATKNSSVNSVVISSEGYYMIPFGNTDKEFIGFYSGIYQEQIERLYEESYMYFNGDTMTAPESFYMTGMVLPCIGKTKGYMKEMMGADNEDYYVTYYLYPVDMDMVFRGLCIIFVVLIIGVLCTAEANRQQKRMFLHGISDEQKKEIRKGKHIMFAVVLIIAIAVCSYVFF